MARGLLGIFACAVALAIPAGAAAKPGYYVLPQDHFAEAEFRGSNGYRLEIKVFSDLFFVTASKATDEAVEQVMYFFFDSKLRDDMLHARLPRVGRIDLRFHERSRSREDPAPNCDGVGELTRQGTFRGRIKLSGEHGFTDVDVRAVRGKIVDEPKQVCRRSGRAQSSSATQEELLRAVVPRGHGILEFSAIQWASNLDFLPNVFAARLIRQRGPMFVISAVYGPTEDPEAITLSRPPLSGSAVPPKPFTGTATFQRESDGAFTWLGDLAAELPGVGPVRLAGPKFNAEACLGRICKGSAEIEPQGKGSHSRPLALARLLFGR